MPIITHEELESLRCCGNCKWKIINKDKMIWHCWKHYKSKTKARYDPNKNCCKDHDWQEIQLPPELTKKKEG